LEARSDDGLGWSLAFKALLWARLSDGDHAWKLMRLALAPAYGMDIRYDNGGGVYPNLFDACPPFQIDGNFGVTAAIAELLLQSQEGRIHLLPALPETWKNGVVSGLRARGGFEIDMAWKDGRLVAATIKSSEGGTSHVYYAGKAIMLKMKRGESVRLDGTLSQASLKMKHVLIDYQRLTKSLSGRYSLIHAKLRQFQRKLAGGPGWIRIPSLPPISRVTSARRRRALVHATTSKRATRMKGGVRLSALTYPIPNLQNAALALYSRA
jgi:hypothetical protein